MKTGALYREGACAIPRVWHADRWPSRLRGLLGRPPLAAAEALLLTPCAGVHTFGMRYPLDIVFLGRRGEVLGWRENLPPWRASQHRGAYHTLELRAGGLRDLQPTHGEVLTWKPAN